MHEMLLPALDMLISCFAAIQFFPLKERNNAIIFICIFFSFVGQFFEIANNMVALFGNFLVDSFLKYLIVLAG